MTKFIIYPHIYCFAVGNKQLLYNTKTGIRIESDSTECKELIDEIYKPVNLGVVDLTESRLNNMEIQSFIEQITTQDFGKAIETNSDSPRFINLLPVLNLQDDVERLEKDKESDIGEKALRYLNELHIYLNNLCDLDCRHCNSYYKQTESCYKSPSNTTIQPDTVKRILDSLAYSSLKKINFSGGNILLYPRLDELITLLKSYDFDFHFWIHISNLIETNNSLACHKEILVNFPANAESIINYIKAHKTDDKIIYHFLIENESHYKDTELILTETGINNYQITPIYTAKNIAFFAENIYLSKEDIFVSPILHRIIFCNQKLNSNYFGKLYILSNGEIKADINASTLGNIHKNSLLEIITKELMINTAWRKIRNEKPCNDCLYQYLCPPPSNYETAIGKPNLCHVKP